MRAVIAKALAATAGLAFAGPVGAASAPQAVQTVTVTARGETAPVATANGDAADDPAIWRNRRAPSHSLVVATDKRAGLYVYGLDGKARSFTPAGRVNNVDLVDLGRRGVIVVASDRNDETKALLQVYRLDTRSASLVPLGAVAGGAGEGYGVCLMARRGVLHAYSVLKHGEIHEVALTLADAGASGSPGRTWRLQTQSEGCVADPRSGMLYVGEEDRGIWAFDTRQPGVSAGRLAAPVDGVRLLADVEGLSIASRGRNGGWLVASSQGDNAYALYRLPRMEFAGRFRIAAGDVGGTEETDGIAVALGSFGAGYEKGLMVVQDGQNAPSAQNFKFVSWRDVLVALKPRHNGQ